MALEFVTFVFSSPLACTALVVAVVLLVCYLGSRPSNLPPFPVRPYPILGHLPFLKNSPRETIAEWTEKAGEVFSLYMGATLVVSLNSLEVLRETLVKQADHFTDRPPSFVGTISQEGEKGIINNSGPEWKEQRAVTQTILRNFGMGKNSLAENIQEEVAAYLSELSKYQGKPAQVRTLTNASVSNVICAIIVGHRFEFSDPFFINFMHIFNELAYLLAGTTTLFWFHWLRFLPGDFFNAKKIAQNQKALVNYFSDRYIKKSWQSDDEDRTENFITAYLTEADRRSNSGDKTTLNGVNLRRVIANLFVAGSETTSTTMMWFMLYMLHYPDIQKKVYKEIEDVVGTERVPGMNDRVSLTYLSATIMETQRIASIVPLSLTHMCTSDVTVRGYTIPKGARIWPNLDAVLRDKKTWGDPMNFRPERFLDKTGTLVVPEQFVPFSLGRRACLGESLAKMELFLFLSALIQKFELVPAQPDKLPPCKAIFGVTSAPETFELRFVQRRRS